MIKPTRKPRKSDRDRMAGNAKFLASLLLHEASGGTIPLPKGLETYAAPAIPFPERRALLDSISRLMLTDLKVDPEEEVSGFELLRGGYGGGKRDSREDSDGRVSSAAPAVPAAADESAQESYSSESAH